MISRSKSISTTCEYKSILLFKLEVKVWGVCKLMLIVIDVVH